MNDGEWVRNQLLNGSPPFSPKVATVVFNTQLRMPTVPRPVHSAKHTAPPRESFLSRSGRRHEVRREGLFDFSRIVESQSTLSGLTPARPSILTVRCCKHQCCHSIVSLFVDVDFILIVQERIDARYVVCSE